MKRCPWNWPPVARALDRAEHHLANQSSQMIPLNISTEYRSEGKSKRSSNTWSASPEVEQCLSQSCFHYKRSWFNFRHAVEVEMYLFQLLAAEMMSFRAWRWRCLFMWGGWWSATWDSAVLISSISSVVGDVLINKLLTLCTNRRLLPSIIWGLLSTLLRYRPFP